MTPETIAVDTNLLVRFTARRFLMAAWERRGAQVPVLPRVLQELYGVLPARELAEAILSELSRSLARATEERRYTAVRKAAIEAGPRPA